MTILGVDLSTTCSAAVALPANWDGDWRRVRSLIAGEPLHKGASDLERIQRCENIAREIVGFAKQVGAREVWIEGYAYGMKTAAHTLGELGGIVRLELMRAGFRVRTANISTARALFLGKGKVKRKDGNGNKIKNAAKLAARDALRAAGVSFETLDEVDAFVCANYGASEAGIFFYGQAA